MTAQHPFSSTLSGAVSRARRIRSTSRDLAGLLEEFSEVLPHLDDAPVLVQIDPSGVAHAGRCVSTGRFSNISARDAVTLTRCCPVCMPASIGVGGGTARMFDEQLADLRDALAEPTASRQRALHLSRLLIAGRNRALHDHSFFELRNGLLLPEIALFQSALATHEAAAADGLLLMSIGDVLELTGGKPREMPIDAPLFQAFAERVCYCSPTGSVYALAGTSRIAGRGRTSYGTPVSVHEGSAGTSRADLRSRLEIVGMFGDDASAGAIPWEPLVRWWEIAELLD